MKILYVHGGDYAALTFENDMGVQKAQEMFANNPEQTNPIKVESDEGDYSLQIREFGEIDPKFIEFVKDIQDYDDSKNSNFYVLNN